jgi:arylsulfatase A-like enzyme
MWQYTTVMNVLFIMSDQQRVDSIGPDRHPCADFPVMERLRSESLSFDNFYASAIPCVPSRQAMLTGRQNWMSRVFGNSTFNMGDDQTWMSILRDNGYQCVSVGKTHLVHAGSYHIQISPRQSFGGQRGFDHFHPAGTPEDDENYFDIHTTQRACEALRRLKEGGPFALFVGYHAPHEPYVMPEHYLGFVDPADVPLPDARAENEYETKSAGYRARVDLFKNLFGGIDDEKTRIGIAGHYCLLKMLDDCLGTLLGEVEELGLLDDTLIVYCSDHGDLLGEHWIFNKAATFYESEVRIPMMIRFPDGSRAGASTPCFASGIDVLPTILELLDIRADVALPGLSLVPVIRDDETVREFVTCSHTRAMMIRTADRKLWYDVSARDGEMYDLAGDSHELVNLYGSQDHVEMRRELFELMLHARMRDDAVFSRLTQRQERLYREVWSSYEPEVPSPDLRQRFLARMRGGSGDSRPR